MFNKYFNYFLLLVLVIWISFYNDSTIKELFENRDGRKIVLITGSSQGIGQMISNNLDPKKYLVITQGTRPNSKLNYIQANFSNQNQINLFVSKIIKQYGPKPIDIFINSFWDSSDDKLDYQVDINLTNTIKLFERIIPLMNTNGFIINLSTLSKPFTLKNRVDNYLLIKSNLNSYIKLKSLQLYSKQISVCTLKIDKPYGTKLNNYSKLLEQNLTEIIPGINFIINNDWNVSTGREFSSTNIKDKRLGYYLEMSLPYLDNYTISDSILSQKNNGENFMVPNIANKELCTYNNYSGELVKKLAQIHRVNTCDIFLYHGMFETLDKMINIFVQPNHNVVGCSLNWLSKIKTNSELIDIDCNIINNKQVPNYDKILESINSFTRMIYLIAPLESNDFNNFVKKVPFNIPIVIDFCYDDFIESNTKIKMGDFLKYTQSIICLNTFSKFYSLPGIHLGYSIAKPDLNKIIGNYIKYPINTFYEKIAISVLDDKKYQNKIRTYFSKQIKTISDYLIKQKIKFFIENPITIVLVKNKNNKVNEVNKIEKLFKKQNLGDFVFVYNYDDQIHIKLIINRKDINVKSLGVVKKVFGS